MKHGLQFYNFYALCKHTNEEVWEYITWGLKACGWYIFKMSDLTGLYNTYRLMNRDIIEYY